MKLLKNFLYNQLYQLFMVLIPLITVPYISRVIGTEGVGLYSYSASYAQYFVLFGMLGIDLYGNRQIARCNNTNGDYNKEFSNIYTLQFISTLVAFLLYILIFVVINKNNRILYLAQSILVLSSMFDISWLFIGLEDMKNVVLRNLLIKILAVILIFSFVKNESDIILYSFIMASSTLLGQIIMWIGYRKVARFEKPCKVEVIKHLNPAIAIFISQIAIQIYALLDKTMLGIIADIPAVGLYSNAQKTIKVVLTLITSLGIVMLPRMSVLYAEKKYETFKSMIYKSFSFVNFMAFPMIFGLIGISNGFSIWFYGEEFAGIQYLLQVGAIIILVASWSNILGIQVMLSMGKEKEFTISVVIGAIINFVMNLILIPKFSAMGAMISSIVSESIVMLVQLYILRRIVNVVSLIKKIIKPVLCSLIMFIVIKIIVMYFNISVISTFLEILIGMIVYIFLMFVTKCEFLNDAIYIVKIKFSKK